jgi:hypothetical protein
MNSAMNLFFRSSLISFLGALPLGTLNISALRISEYSIASAFAFITAVVISEMAVVWVLLKFTHRIVIPSFILKGIWLSVIFLLFFMTWKSLSSNGAPDIAVFSPMVTIAGALASGLLLSMTNPLQCLFWLGWNEMLYRHHATTQPMKLISYLAGIGIGTFAALGLYILIGVWSFNNHSSMMKYLPLLAGFVYGISALWLLYMFFKTFKTTQTTAI